RHRIFVVHPAERLLLQVNLRYVGRPGRLRAQAARDFAGGVRQLLQQTRADGQEVATGEANDLLHLAKTRAHDLGLVAKLLEVVVNPGDRNDPRVFVSGDVAAALLLVPVVDAADERRDQRHPRLGAGHGLGEAEEERQVAVDALALELFGGANAFPGAGELDEDAFPADPRPLIHAGQLARLGQ